MSPPDAPAEPPEDLVRLLESSGAGVSESRRIDHGTQHRVARGAEKVTLNLYDSEKVLVQGKNTGLKVILESWKEERRPAGNSGKAGNAARRGFPEPDATPRVGTDEAGKGDYFGPLVVAGALVGGEETDQMLRGLGVRDSKLLEGDQALRMAEGIRETLGEENLRVLCLEPQEFERRRLRAGENVNRLLGELNVGIILELDGAVERFVVDEFARKAGSYIGPHVPAGVELEVRPRAEDDTAVAAASVLARARYLEEMEKLSRWAGFTLPRGATHVKSAARRILSSRGREGLERVAKISFSTTKNL